MVVGMMFASSHFYIGIFTLSTFYQLQMKSEQLFEIERQISQIRKSLEQRQERVAQWSVPIAHILKERKDKDSYLSKKYPSVQRDKQNVQGKDLQVYKRELTTHVGKSRIKIRGYKNDLKELHELVKKRNIVRLRRSCYGGSGLNFNHEEVNKDGKINKAFSKTNYETMGSHDLCKKTERGHNILSTIKGDKILELYQQCKVRFGNGENSICNLKRQLGMGLENTPFYSWLANKNKTDDPLVGKQQSIQTMNKQPIHYDLYNQMKKQMGAKKKIYINVNNKQSAKFQRRLKNIIRYHQENIEALV